MSTLGRWLTELADAVRWLAGAALAVLSRLWAPLDAVFDPVVSPVLAWVSPLCRSAGDLTYAVFDPLPPLVGLVVLSAVAGAILLIAFRYLSHQRAIGRIRDEITAHLLAMKLYRDQLRTMMRSQVRVLWAIVRLQGYVLVPLLILCVPFLLVVGQMAGRYQWAPLPVDEPFLLEVQYSRDAPNPPSVVLERDEAFDVEVDGIVGDGKVLYRLRPRMEGRRTLRFQIGGTVVEKEAMVGGGAGAVSPVRPDRHWTSQLLYPLEPPIPRGVPAAAIRIDCPPRASRLYGSDWWMLTFFVVSMAVALALKPVVGVRF